MEQYDWPKHCRILCPRCFFVFFIFLWPAGPFSRRNLDCLLLGFTKTGLSEFRGRATVGRHESSTSQAHPSNSTRLSGKKNCPPSQLLLQKSTQNQKQQ